ncbi:MAG: ATP-binding cassette domain-containing protein [Clostridia bacterium]|nr:ATP-binding cassette domain-containing protein [Clostridia bacterium]
MNEIRILGLEKSYGAKNVLKGLSLEASAGELITILGANGSGKSTLLSILGGTLKADAGSFMINGEDLFKNKKLLSRTVGYVPQHSPLIDELSAKDNLLLWYSKEKMEHSLSEGLLKLLGIGDFLKVRASKLSGGMKKRLSIGCALSGDPLLLLLDEPSAALDLPSRRQLDGYIDSLVALGKTVFCVTHETDRLKASTRCHILKNGVLSPFSPELGDEKLLWELESK